MFQKHILTPFLGSKSMRSKKQVKMDGKVEYGFIIF
jgi:hypothetical protein